MKVPSRRPLTAVLGLAALLAAAGCTTIKRTAMNQVGDALSGGGTTFASDDDPQLIRDAAPFSLKLMETVLADNPGHRGLRQAAASGFVQYAYAFVQQDADEVEAKDFTAALALRERARRLYLRARDHGLAGLETTHAGFAARLRAGPRAAVRDCTRDDVPLLYWTGVAWAAAVAQAKDNPDLIADLPVAAALVDRALELDEAFDHGAIHGFLITYEMNRQGGTGDPAERSRRHFNRAMELSGGGQAAPLVAFAEAVTVQQQNRAEFSALLQQALAINPDARPEWRLVNLVMQRRARRLLAEIDNLFPPPAGN